MKISHIGQRLVVGFSGVAPEDEEVQILSGQIREGLVGGVLLFRHNIVAPAQVRRLTEHLKSCSSDQDLFVLVDQEGGKVQRLGSSNGFQDFQSARAVASSLSYEEAFEHYTQLGAVLKGAGINFDFAPCSDIDCDPPCAAIGKFERSYSDDPGIVSEYSRMFVRGLHESGVLSCVKHFPGHGLAKGDTHQGVVDVTMTWQEEELLPYEALMESGDLDSVMVAHIIHQDIDKDVPASLSRAWLEKLRNQIGFDGVAVSDDLHMGAIQQYFDFKSIVQRSLQAGVDLLVFSNNPAAAQGVENFKPDPELPSRFQKVVQELLDEGLVSTDICVKGVDRILALKQKMRSFS